MSAVLRTAIVLVLLVAVSALCFLVFFKNDTRDPYRVRGCDLSVPLSEIPTFTQAAIDFTHKFDGKRIHPLLASALIDIDGDGIDEIFFGAGVDQPNALFRFDGSGFLDISSEVGLNDLPPGSTTGAVSYDLDDNGHVDLLLTRPDGVWLLANDGSRFSPMRLNIETDAKSSSATITLADYDADGLVDIFLCTYIKIEMMEGQTIFNRHGYGSNSLLFRNLGALEFEDVTDEAGLRYTHNTFQAIFIDLDADSAPDLVVAYDTGEARIYRNNADGTFSLADTPMTGRFAYPMGIGIGDINNDGRPDLFFSNTGSTIPEFLARGDLRKDQDFNPKWMLWRNDGDFQFTDVAEELRVADFEFSWGGLLHDFNLDGRQDLVVAESYVAFPPHALFALPCRFLIQRPDHTFASVEQQAGVENKHFAITPLTSDWNDDGYPDLAWANLKGPARVFLSDAGPARSVRVRIAETNATPGTKVVVKTSSGATLTDWYIIGEGLASDQSNLLIFGLGAEDTPKNITITFPDGEQRFIVSPEAGKTYNIKR